MKKLSTRTKLVLTGVAGAALGAACMLCLYAYRFGGFESYAAVQKLSQVYNIISRDYVGDADMNDVTDAACYAMVDATGDKWSTYFSAEDYARYKQVTANIYDGIGITIQKDSATGLYTVSAVLEDTPASRAGIQIGETLLSVGDSSLKGKTADQIRTLISAQKGDFQLGLRAADGTERSVTVSRTEIVTKPVSYEMLDSGLGYIRIKNFETGAGSEINAAVDDLVKQGAKGIVFDVREDPGGMLDELLKALDHILPAGDIFVSRDENGGEKVETSDASCVKLPMTVLVDENTYSAAEFFAAALSEYKWAKIVGAHTTGKSRSQISIELGDGSAVHISTRGYLTPHRVDLAEQGGLTPDIAVTLSESELAQLQSGRLSHDADRQLQAAVSTLKNEIKG